MVVSYIFLIVVFFIYLIICAVIYLSFQNQYEKYYQRKKNRLRQFVQPDIVKQYFFLMNGITLPAHQIKQMNKNLTNKYYLDIFNETIIQLSSYERYKKYGRVYMGHYHKLIYDQLKKIDKQPLYIQTHRVYLLGIYQVDTLEIRLTLLQSLRANSLYLKYNAFTAIAKIGDVDLFIEAFTLLANQASNLNNKLFIDAMAYFSGDEVDVEKKLIETYQDVNVETKVIIIHHFTHTKNSRVSALLLKDLMTNSLHKELKLAIIKYFNEIYDESVLNVLLEFLHHEEWEYRALTAKALVNYQSDLVFEALLESIKDHNWYVRLNSAKTLWSFERDQYLDDLIDNLEDPYAIDILNYTRMRSKA